MKKLQIIPTQLTAIAFLLIYLNSCYGQIQNKNANSEDGKANLFHPSYSFDAISNSIDKNIRSIFQDRNGNYWFGTNGAGVYRYDTKTLTQYTIKDGLADNQVINIQEDDLGNIWFGTGVFGISKFDGTKFTTLTNKVELTNGTETDWKSTNNNLWFYAGGGVFQVQQFFTRLFAF